MIQYYLLYSIVVFFKIIDDTFQPSTRKRYILFSSILCLLIWGLLAFRNETMGIDLPGYLESFDILSQTPFSQLLKMKWRNYDKGYMLLNRIVGIFSPSRQCFLAVCALCSIYPIMYILGRNSKDSLFSLVVYMALPTFLLLFSGLRQAIALGICLFSTKYIKEKKLVKFALSICIAFFFHYTAFVFLVAYPLFWYKPSKIMQWISFGLLPLCFLLKEPLFALLSKLVKENAEIDNNGALTLFLVFCVIYLFCIIYVDRTKDDQNGFANIFFLACFCQAMAGMNSIVIRIGYYFMNVLPLLLPAIISNFRAKSTKWTINLILYTLFIAYGIYALANGEWAMTNPYYFCWE